MDLVKTGERAAISLDLGTRDRVSPWSVFSSDRTAQTRQHTVDLLREVLLKTQMHYDRRRGLLKGLYESGDFRSLESCEGCIEACLDALGAAPEFVAGHIDDLGAQTEVGNVFALVAAACRQDDEGAALLAIEALDLEEPKTRQAVDDALMCCAEWPSHEHASVRIEPRHERLGAERLSPDVRTFYTSAIGADQTKSIALVGQSAEFEKEPHYLIALGLVGSVQAVSVLLDALGDEGTAPHAADALELMLGAGLLGTRWKREVLDDDALFEEELKRRHAGDAEVGVVHRQSPGIVTSKPIWTTWWAFHGDRFEQGVRYRRGQPMSARVAVEALSESLWNRTLRDAFIAELEMRYQNPVRIDTSMTVRAQLVALQRMRPWAEETDTSHMPGQWHRIGS